MLKFNPSWRFHSPGPIPDGVSNDFFNLIGRVAGQGDRQRILEHFKHYFANAAGSTSTWSSSTSWAETDLLSHMHKASANAPLFIEGFYSPCVSLQARHPEYGVPDPAMINHILARHNVGYDVQPPNLIARNPAQPVPVPTHVPSLDEQAQELIQQSLGRSEEYLTLGQHRQAVQEVLWLLESIATLFEGLEVGAGTVHGKYFNKIADDLRRYQRGTTFEQVMNWATTLHGYLSSPTGGGVRHGANLRIGISMEGTEARLFLQSCT